MDEDAVAAPTPVPDVLGSEDGVDAAEAAPQHHAGVVEALPLGGREAVDRLPRALVAAAPLEDVARAEAAPAGDHLAEVTVGHEEDLLALPERPADDGLRVRARAHGAA